MRREHGWWLIALSLFGGAVVAPVQAADVDEKVVRKELMERFDENRNDKLETLEAKQARARLRNLMEDKTERELNIHTWRDDVKPLLMALDPDEDRRLTTAERDSAAAILERLIPKVDQEDNSNKKEKSTAGSDSGERKRKSSQRRSQSGGYRSGIGWSSRGGGSMGGGGWGMNLGFGVGGGSSSNGTSSRSSSSLDLGFFSGSGAENANPAKGELGQSDSMSPSDRSQSSSDAGRLGLGDDREPLDDSKNGNPAAGSTETKPKENPAGEGKDRQKPKSPDKLGDGVDPGSGDESPSKPSTPSGPKLIPPIPRPGF